MKQPSIKLFGEVHKVVTIDFNQEGLIDRVVYKSGEKSHNSVFRKGTILNDNLTTERKIDKPTIHPFSGYVHAPDIERLLV